MVFPKIGKLFQWVSFESQLVLIKLFIHTFFVVPNSVQNISSGFIVLIQGRVFEIVLDILDIFVNIVFEICFDILGLLLGQHSEILMIDDVVLI